MTARIDKHSVIINGRRTSVSLEHAFWSKLHGIAAQRRQPMSQLVAGVARLNKSANLSSALRLFVLENMLRTSGTASAAPPLASAPFTANADQNDVAAPSVRDDGARGA